MTEQELQAILQSDMKLWDAAETTEAGNTIVKTLNLPYGIGRKEVTLEGLDNASARRSALESFGNYIRGVIEDKIGEESVTARAIQKAARASDGSSHSPDVIGVDISRPGGTQPVLPTEMVDTEAVETFDVFTSGPEALADRIAALRETITVYEGHLETLKFQLRAGVVLQELYHDASTHKKTPQPVKGAALKEED